MLAANIKEWGRELGFQAVGISDTALDEAEAHMLEWLARGNHGEMDYMAKHGVKRSRPAELVPGTLRVISLRMDYYPPDAKDAWEVLRDGSRAFISRYALGRDYHKVLRNRLEKLAENIRAKAGGFSCRVFTDSAPVLEVELARKAHLGWRGKHVLLLSRAHGSWFFLGELYTDLPLPTDAPNGHDKVGNPGDKTTHARFHDGTTSHSTRLPKDGNQVAGYLPNPLDGTTSHSTKLQTTATKSLVIPQAGNPHPSPLPEGEGSIALSPAGGKLDRGLGANESLREFHVNENHCGTCNRCIEICPTQAIVAPYQLDARRCISYLTIELKGSIPPELRPLIGNRIYGCDDCQLVCPWNRFAHKSMEADFAVRNGLDDVALTELFAWDEMTFKEKLAGSAIYRIGHEQWLRNIAVALGNAPKSKEVLTALHARAQHESALVREHVAWALEQYRAPIAPGNADCV